MNTDQTAFVAGLKVGDQVVTGGQGYPWRLMYVTVISEKHERIMLAENTSYDWGVFSQFYDPTTGEIDTLRDDNEPACYMYPADEKYRRIVDMYITLRDVAKHTKEVLEHVGNIGWDDHKMTVLFNAAGTMKAISSEVMPTLRDLPTVSLPDAGQSDEEW